MAAANLIANLQLIPATEAIAKVVEEIKVTARAACDVLFERESFSEFSSFLDRVVPVLTEISSKNSSPNTLRRVADELSRESKEARKLASDCNQKNRVYLLVNCRRILGRLESSAKKIGRALGLLDLASLEISADVKDEIGALIDAMERAEFKAAVAEEEVLENIERGVHQRNADRAYANRLMSLIADALGIPPERAALKREFEEFKREVAEAQLKKDQAEAIQMDQIIALLSRSDAALSFKEKESRYHSKKGSLGNQPLEPLQSFYCPITRDVMVDPVETPMGQTFERSAIEKWLSNGNVNCPLTMAPLEIGLLRPNITLRKSIEEWKERNSMILIASMRSQLGSEDEQVVVRGLGQLLELCEEDLSKREFVVLENYVPIFVGFLKRKGLVRTRALELLIMLAKDSNENKEIIAKVDNTIELTVRLLAKSIGEGKLAVALLLELSKNKEACNHIGRVQGCILLLVTMLNSDNAQAANDARELLENLSFLDQNVVQMAKANYFTPLLRRITSGSEDVKLSMVTALSKMELTDHSKADLFENGVLPPLLHMIENGNTEIKIVAGKSLQNLSSLPKNGLQMIRDGAVRPLLHLVYHNSITSSSLQEQTAAIIMNLAISATKSEADSTLILLDSDKDIFHLFSLVNLTRSTVQCSIIRAFLAMCQLSSAVDMKVKLRQCSAIQVLIPHCGANNPMVRANAIKLMSCLLEDRDDDTSVECVNQTCLENVLTVIKTSNDEEEIAAALGVISLLPTAYTHFTLWLLDAGALPIITSFFTNGNQNMSSENHLTENAVRALCRFTISARPDWQKKVADLGVIPTLVRLLGSGSSLTKKHAAISLAQFSESSTELSRPIKRQRGFMCFAPQPETGCLVHNGMCSIESSFCLVEADAVEPLVKLLGDRDSGASEASLLALMTLIDGVKLQSGVKVIAEADGIIPMIRLLSSSSVELQEKCLLVLERVFRLEEMKRNYGALAQTLLVEMTQRGSGNVRASAAQILAHLNVLHEQSSYF